MSDLADVRRFDASALGFTEGHVQGKLDRQTSHGSSGQGLNLGHGLNQSGFGLVCLQRHLKLHKSTVSDFNSLTYKLKLHW